jgi:DNA polymerase-3 subunit alpha
MAAQLTSNADNKDKSAIYLAECRRLHVKVLPPDVNESAVQFSAVGGNIRFGLGAVRNVGTGVAESIMRTRQEKGAYTSFADFLSKVDASVCAKRVIESLIKAGAFDSLGHTRLALIQVHEEAVEAMASLKKQEALGQFDLFGTDSGAPAEESTSPLAHLRYTSDEWPRKHLLAQERDMLGLYVSAHPLDGAEGLLRKHAPKPIATLIHDAPKDGEVVVAGIISSVDRRVNKNGEPWAIVTIEDLDASIEVLFFAKSYSVMHEELVPDSAVAVKGRVNWRDDTMSIFAGGLITLDISSAEHNPTAAEQPAFVLRAEAEQLDQDNVAELRSALEAHRGETPVQIVLCGSHEIRMAVPDLPVKVSGALLGEIKSIRGITVESTSTA